MILNPVSLRVARQHYNKAVAEYNIARRRFPGYSPQCLASSVRKSSRR